MSSEVFAGENPKEFVENAGLPAETMIDFRADVRITVGRFLL